MENIGEGLQVLMVLLEVDQLNDHLRLLFYRMCIVSFVDESAAKVCLLALELGHG